MKLVLAGLSVAVSLLNAEGSFAVPAGARELAYDTGAVNAEQVQVLTARNEFLLSPKDFDVYVQPAGAAMPISPVATCPMTRETMTFLVVEGDGADATPAKLTIGCPADSTRGTPAAATTVNLSARTGSVFIFLRDQLPPFLTAMSGLLSDFTTIDFAGSPALDSSVYVRPPSDAGPASALAAPVESGAATTLRVRNTLITAAELQVHIVFPVEGILDARTIICPVTGLSTTEVVVDGSGLRASCSGSDPTVPLPDVPRGFLFVALRDLGSSTDTLIEDRLSGDWTMVHPSGASSTAAAIHFRAGTLGNAAPGADDLVFEFDGVEFAGVPAIPGANFLAPDADLTADLLIFTVEGKVGTPVTSVPFFAFLSDESASLISGSPRFDQIDRISLQTVFGSDAERPNGPAGTAYFAGHVEFIPEINLDGVRPATVGWLMQSLPAGARLTDGMGVGGDSMLMSVAAGDGAWAHELRSDPFPPADPLPATLDLTRDSDGDGIPDDEDLCPIPDPCVDPTAIVHPSVILDPSAIIGPGAEISRNVVIEANTMIGAQVLIRRDTFVAAGTEIGDNSFVGRNVVLEEESSIGFGSEIGSFSWLRAGATVGDETSIHRAVFVGSGAQIADSVVVRRNVAIGRNTVLGAGTRIGRFVFVRRDVNVGSAVRIGRFSVVVSDVPDETVIPPFSFF